MQTRSRKGSHLFSALARFLIAGAVFTLGPVITSAHVPAGSAMAAQQGVDKLHLKDGRVLEGTVEKEVNGYIWFKTKVGAIEQREVFGPEKIEKLERGVAVDPAEPVKAEPDRKEAPAPAGAPGVPRAVVLTLGDRTEDKDMVGKYMCAKPLLDAIPKLEEEIGKDGSGVVVLRIDSGGGMLLEIPKLHDAIEKEFKPRFRTVAWIKWAISAAAMTSHVVEEIYFYPEGNYGACTGFNGGNMKAIVDRPLEEVLFMMEKASARGKKDKAIMRSMQILDAPLSCTIDANGDVHWFQDAESGEIKVNAGDKILTFTSLTAEQTKFSKGTTDDYRQLASLMGYQELNWIGQRERGTPWPVSQSELIQRRFRDRTFEDEKATNAYFVDYQGSVEAARSSQDKTTRGKFVGRARVALDKIKGMVKNNPNFALLVFGRMPDQFKEWVDEQEQMLRDLMK
jgi:hypothetical protein